MSASLTSTYHILVVDDEPLVCDAVRLMLSFDGHRVEVVNSGKAALELLAKSEFDLVITDFNMPEMKGDELAAAIKARKPAQPVMMITAYPELVIEAGKVPKHIDEVIAKPFRMDELRGAVARVTLSKK